MNIFKIPSIGLFEFCDFATADAADANLLLPILFHFGYTTGIVEFFSSLSITTELVVVAAAAANLII
ncbi:hypothetical protein DERF_009024 [Dermatophagoides farinae]|uniref:Uncharacterized protein n=1 Tax=Dermatophagoides farinae TaxID=6954 RepID=A0A922L598_DERFA|nr:hypothetical protein DERF_009024 [Dermatophagoides farinae]